MNAKEIITELGNAPHASAVTYADPEHMEIVSTDLGLAVHLTVNSFKNVEIEFTVNGKRSIVPNENPYAILSTVKSILSNELIKFIQNYQKAERRRIYVVQFFAVEPSRAKLYDRCVPIISKILGPDWNFKSNYQLDKSKQYRWENFS
jgi:hypothetical protein